MFRLCHKVSMYDKTPFLYSPAWHDWSSRCDVCFPIGIHWLARWIHAFWLWTLYPHARERAVTRAISRAWRTGHDVGLEEGKREAIEEFMQRLRAARDGDWVVVPEGVSIECAVKLQAEAIKERNDVDQGL